MPEPHWVFDDGGRSAAGYKGLTGDCAVRAAAIAAQLDYTNTLNQLTQRQTAWALRSRSQLAKKTLKAPSASNGVAMEVMRAFMRDLGWHWQHTMCPGATWPPKHLLRSELPPGRIICRCSLHFVAAIDGTIHDNHDSTREGTRLVYGYWHFGPLPSTHA